MARTTPRGGDHNGAGESCPVKSVGDFRKAASGFVGHKPLPLRFFRLVWRILAARRRLPLPALGAGGAPITAFPADRSNKCPNSRHDGEKKAMHSMVLFSHSEPPSLAARA